MLKEIINVLPKEEYSEFMTQATTITPDEKDTAYFALNFELKVSDMSPLNWGVNVETFKY